MRILLAGFAFASVLPSAFALFGVGDVVYDPINYGVLVETKVETLAQWASAIAKAETQIQNQLQQLEQAKQLLEVQDRVRVTIGDWQTVVDKAKSVELTAQRLTQDYNGDLSSSFVVEAARRALTYTNRGTFAPVATTGSFGQSVAVPDEDLKRYAAVEGVYEKALTTLQGTQGESRQLNEEIAATYQEMTKAGITQQEYEKLRGKIETLTVRQQALQAQRQDALAMIQAQQTLNQNQSAKEQAVNGRLRESDHETLTRGLGQVQFDELTWR
jgi:DNA repair exonuclease SbcCD ATPase subunit